MTSLARRGANDTRSHHRSTNPVRLLRINGLPNTCETVRPRSTVDRQLSTSKCIRRAVTPSTLVSTPPTRLANLFRLFSFSYYLSYRPSAPALVFYAFENR
jgi:hypothetical protein